MQFTFKIKNPTLILKTLGVLVSTYNILARFTIKLLVVGRPCTQFLQKKKGATLASIRYATTVENLLFKRVGYD